ncbi:MAG: hypothetical protein DMG78_05710 [Acidobacteria bacterium]|nr:MAG: hypothetical protein DMG78_05710 [Acidobacteriota bacterium]
MVARDAVETADASLFAAGFSEPNPFQSITSFVKVAPLCDHSVTSADVRLSVGEELLRIVGIILL